jgi:hypothetical protein
MSDLTEFLSTITASALVIPCDDRCMFAKHEDCDCVCGGKNHMRGNLLTPVQREIHRTRAGRRIPVLTPGTAEWDTAVAMYEAREEGDFQCDIAEAFGVSAPTVRRMIKSLLYTLALAGEQAEEAAA